MAASAQVTIKLLADVKAAQAALSQVSNQLKTLQNQAKASGGVAGGGGRNGILGLFGGNHTAAGNTIGRSLGQGIRGGLRSALAIGGSAGGFATMLGSGGLMAIAGGIGAYMIKQAYDFTNAWTNVQKVVNGTPEQMDALKAQAFSLAHEMATSPNEVAGVMAVGGQMNVPTGQMADFTKVMLQASLATDMTSESAANMAGQFANVMQETDPDKWRKIISTVDQLADIIPGGESKVMDMAQRFGLAGKSVGLNSAQVLGYASFATGLGIDPEMGGSALSHMFISLAETGSAARGQTAADPHDIRDASDRAGDLEGDLALAEERRKEMYSTRTGKLLKQYRKHPAEVMASDMQIARLKREQQQAQEALDEASHPGQEKAKAWAKMAGLSLSDYGEQVKSDPAGTFRKVLGGLAEQEQSGNLYGALGTMGVKDIRELMSIAAVQKGMGLLHAAADDAQVAMANYKAVADGTKGAVQGLIDTYAGLDNATKSLLAFNTALALTPAAIGILTSIMRLAGGGGAAGGGVPGVPTGGTPGLAGGAPAGPPGTLGSTGAVVRGGLITAAGVIEANTIDATIHNARLSTEDTRAGNDKGGAGSALADIHSIVVHIQNANGDAEAIKKAVYDGLMQAINKASPNNAPVTPMLGGARY